LQFNRIFVDSSLTINYTIEFRRVAKVVILPVLLAQATEETESLSASDTEYK
jgi:hypothetical protein